MDNDSLLMKALSEPNRYLRRDKLSALIVAVRKGEYKLSLDEAKALYQAQLEEAKRPGEFDGATYQSLWHLLKYSPPWETLKKVTGHLLANPRTICRGFALYYLLNNYPEMAEELLKKHQDDPDPEVQDEIARFLVKKDKRRAIEHWEKALGSDRLPHELAETIPQAIAYFSEKEDLQRYEEWDRRLGGRTIWGVIASLIKERLETKGQG
ncbi:MAG: hypothetical protein N3G78_06930 [Desulfobacterota bacterium]|nr:hypothetical protein [Thermodesulfobacteriota bacterium]